jgi:hypothetical protein
LGIASFRGSLECNPGGDHIAHRDELFPLFQHEAGIEGPRSWARRKQDSGSKLWQIVN